MFVFGPAALPILLNSVNWRVLVKDRFPYIAKLRETICEKIRLSLYSERKFKKNCDTPKKMFSSLCTVNPNKAQS